MRLTLGLSSNTPGYAIRFETGTSTPILEVVKRVVNWCQKIALMFDTRFSKICFLKLRDMAAKDPTNVKYNWYL